MIPNQWYAILDSGEIKTGKPVGVTRLGEKLVETQVGGRYGGGAKLTATAERHA